MKERWNRKKGRFVLEAAVLVPGICILLVYFVYFTLYTHDCAVVTHGVLESGVKGIYRDGSLDQEIQARIQTDLEQKLDQRLLWINDPDIQVKVNPVRVTITASGRGTFLPTDVKTEVQETFYRIAPCQVIRRSRWLRKSGRNREQMMDIRYKRDLNSNYMILTDMENAEKTYEVRMITENRIYGFLPCVEQKQENQTEYFYEITGRQSMELLYERRKLSYRQLVELLKDLLRILDASAEYLLNADHVVLSPEHLYLDTKTERLYVCYYPGYHKEIRESFLNLAEYLMGKLDKSDRKGIEFGYDLYQCALEPNFSLEEILKNHTEPEVIEMEEKVSSVNILQNTADTFVDRVQPSVKKSVQEEILEKTGSWKNFFHKKKKQPVEAYIAEADQIKSGSVLFLREQGMSGETTFLRDEQRSGLLLKSKSQDYPDLKIEGDSYLIGKRKESVDGWVPAPTVSRIHARIIKEEGCYLLEDLNSTNGTWAGQHQLNPYELFPLDNGIRVAFAGAEYEAYL